MQKNPAAEGCSQRGIRGAVLFVRCRVGGVWRQPSVWSFNIFVAHLKGPSYYSPRQSEVHRPIDALGNVIFASMGAARTILHDP
jgi:hypothetical protein